MKYIIGLDNGGTGVKGALFDIRGNEINVAYKKINVISEKEYFVERDIEEVWYKNLEVIKSLISSSNIDPKNIMAIGQSGHGKGLYLLGKDDKVIYNAIHSNDARAISIVDEWKSNNIVNEFNKNFQNPLPSQVPALLKWLDLNTNVLDEVEFILGIKDFISHKLTGEYHHEVTDFSSSGMINFNDNKLNYSLIEKIGLKKLIPKFSDVLNSTDIYGNISKDISKLTGLSTECKVVAGIFDISACSIAMGLIDSSNLCLIGGTWSINGFIAKEPFFRKHETTQNSIYCLKDYYFIEESSPTSASNNEWFVKNFLNHQVDSYNYINGIVNRTATKVTGPIYCPFLYGSNYMRNAKAGLVDINSSDNLGDIYKSIYEGIAFAHKVHMNKLLNIKSEFKSIRVAGGIVNSLPWLQIFSNVLNMPLEVINKKELGAFGAAICAGVGTKIYNSFEDAIGKFVSVHRTIRPQESEVKIYEKKFIRYKEVADFLERS